MQSDALLGTQVPLLAVLVIPGHVTHGTRGVYCLLHTVHTWGISSSTTVDHVDLMF